MDRQFIEAENYSEYKAEDIFKYMYAEMPQELKDQEHRLKEFYRWKEERVSQTIKK